MCGTITISDSKNFINEYPIQGGETIEMEFKTTLVIYQLNIVLLFLKLERDM